MDTNDEIENDLIRKAKNGDEYAFAELLNKYNNTFQIIATKFYNLTETCPVMLSREDLISEMKKQFIIAIRNYDFEYGIKFKTMLYEYLKKRMLQLRYVQFKKLNEYSYLTDKAYNDDNDTTYFDIIPSYNYLGSIEEAEDKMYVEEILNHASKTLTPKELYIFKEIAINGKRIIDVAKYFNVSKQAVSRKYDEIRKKFIKDCKKYLTY